MPSSGPIEAAFLKALETAPILDQDQAAVALGTRYAQLLDAARGTKLELAVIADLGPKYAAVLGSLGMTVAGRGSKLAGGDSGVVPGAAKLDELKERRAARQQRA